MAFGNTEERRNDVDAASWRGKALMEDGFACPDDETIDCPHADKKTGLDRFRYILGIGGLVRFG